MALKGSAKLFPSLFSKPRGVTVIGASGKTGKIGNAVLQNIIQFGYNGNIYPVNAKPQDSILGHRAFQNVNDLPADSCDLAVIVVPSKFVPQAIKDCGMKGIKGAVIISAGFKEMGAEGLQMERDISATAKEYGMKIIGPNTLGIMDTAGDLNASFANNMPPKGKVSFFSQSGALCTSILDLANGNQQHLGFNKFISIGNKMDLNECDFLDYFSEDVDTNVIIGYLEGVVNGPRFLETASRVTKTKPVILVKSACTETGSKAASSHTGTLAGSDLAYEIGFKQSGIIRVDSIQDLLGYSSAFANQPIMENNQVVVITNAGGPGILAADAIEKSTHGLKLASLSDETKAKLKAILPAAASYQNPIDVLGDANAEMYKNTLEVILQDNAIGSVLVLLTPQTSTECELTAQYLGELQQKYNADASSTKKTFLAAFMGANSVEASWKVLSDHKVPNFYEAKHAIGALDAMYQHKKWLVKSNDASIVASDKEADASLDNIDKDKVRALLDHIKYDLGHLATGGFEAREVCCHYGINFPDSKVVNSAEEAAQAANAIGYPVSLKIASTEILHKSKYGGVKLDVKNEQDVRDAYEVMMDKVTTAMPNAKIQGVQVAYFAKDGNADLIIGISRDKQFGPLIMAGVGGVLVEAIKDVVFRVAPVTRSMAYEMIGEIRSQKLLNKHGPYDVEAAVDTIMRVSRLATDFPEIEEFDINPLICYGPGEGAVCVDMRLRMSDDKKFEK